MAKLRMRQVLNWMRADLQIHCHWGHLTHEEYAVKVAAEYPGNAAVATKTTKSGYIWVTVLGDDECQT